jgi:hypothetical protein
VKRRKTTLSTALKEKMREGRKGGKIEKRKEGKKERRKEGKKERRKRNDQTCACGEGSPQAWTSNGFAFSARMSSERISNEAVSSKG